jgi:putative oxidoreductase
VTTIPRETARSGRSAVVSRVGPVTHALLRIGVALLFMQHGVQKLFGLFGGVGPTPGGTVTLWSRMGLAGVLETFGGLLLLLGLFTRPVAFLVAGEMLVAFFQVPVAKVVYRCRTAARCRSSICWCSFFCWATARGRRASTADGGGPDPVGVPFS